MNELEHEISVDRPFIRDKLKIHRQFLKQLYKNSPQKNKTLLTKANDSQLNILLRILSLIANHVIPISYSDGCKLNRIKKKHLIKQFRGFRFFREIIKAPRIEKLKLLQSIKCIFKIILKPIFENV